VFADIDPATGNLDAKKAAAAVTKKTRAVVPVDYSGRPVELDAFRELADDKGLVLIEDACHALGASYKGRKIGSIADLTVFSFHPVKSITTGEGGAVLCGDKTLYDKLVRFRTHGITRGRDWEYAVEEMGQNCRLTDLQSALGISQLKRLDGFVKRRREIAARYDKAFQGWDSVERYPIDAGSSWHLYPLRLSKSLAPRRREIFQALRSGGIGVQVHYIPVDSHPLYRSLGYKPGACPVSDDFYAREISIPMYPTLTDAEQDQVVKTLKDVLGKVPA
jgi:dTDP-4-amino-4,6-dideoxygalactose transaminase